MGSTGRISVRIVLLVAIATGVSVILANHLAIDAAASDPHDHSLNLALAAITGILLTAILAHEFPVRSAGDRAATGTASSRDAGTPETAALRWTTRLGQATGLLSARDAARGAGATDLALFLESSRQAGLPVDLHSLLEMTLQDAERLIGYTDAIVWKSEGGQLVPLNYRGILPGERILRGPLAAMEFPVDQKSMLRGRLTIIHDLQNVRKPGTGYLSLMAQALRDVGLVGRSWMGVPLAIENSLVGLLCLDHESPSYFSRHHAQLAEIIANRAAAALFNAATYENAQRAAVQKERARLARDLHDSVMQAVYGVVWNVRGAYEVLPDDATRASELLQRALANANTCLVEMRSLVFELRPELMEQYGLAGSLARHVEALQGGYPIDLRAEIGGEPDLPLSAKEALYRIAQEALQNAVKHSQACKVSLRVWADAEEVTLEVVDDGVGFDPSRASPAQLGLLSMRERAAQLGGKLQINSARGHGTRIHVEVPIHPAQASA